jgi:predicted enzyme related to lactoylglutathione lyase
MPEVKSHKPGAFSWADLATTDQAAAKKFYSNLFGWKTQDTPMPQGGAYTMGEIRGHSVSGISTQMPDQVKAGIPPHWTAYFTVQNVDESLKKASTLGGKVLMPATDVMDVGRMAVIQDPSGAPFAIWQAKKHIGTALTQEAGTICWAELESRNIDAAGSFYSKLFGWNAEIKDMGNMKYTVFTDGNDQRAGMMAPGPQTPSNVPSHWMIYFQVSDVDATVKKAQADKSKTIVPPTDIPNVGRFAILSDPQGAAFGLLQPAPR